MLTARAIGNYIIVLVTGDTVWQPFVTFALSQEVRRLRSEKAQCVIVSHGKENKVMTGGVLPRISVS